MKYATNNIYSIVLLGCSGMMIPVLSVAFVAWANMQFFGWEPAYPIRDLGWVCLLLVAMIAVPGVGAVLLGVLLGPAESTDAT